MPIDLFWEAMQDDCVNVAAYLIPGFRNAFFWYLFVHIVNMHEPIVI